METSPQEAFEVIALATNDCSNPLHRIHSLEAWRSGLTLLDVMMMYDLMERYHLLIRASLLATLIGLRNWVVAYPGVYVRFDIYAKVNPEKAIFIGYGLLTQWVD